jgi:hypothetical protein
VGLAILATAALRPEILSPRLAVARAAEPARLMPDAAPTQAAPAPQRRLASATAPPEPPEPARAVRKARPAASHRPAPRPGEEPPQAIATAAPRPPAPASAGAAAPPASPPPSDPNAPIATHAPG